MKKSSNPLDNIKLPESQTYLRDERLPRVDAKFEMTEQQVTLAGIELLKCKTDIRYFAENFFFITTVDDGKLKIDLYAAQKRVLRTLERDRFVAVCASRQCGKALALDTPVPTPTGWKTMGELQDGDKVFGREGNVITVVKAHDVLYNRKCYELTFSSGEKIVADEDHRWPAQSHYDRCHDRPASVYTTKQMSEQVLVNTKTPSPNYSVPVAGPLQYTEAAFPIHPTSDKQGLHYIQSIVEVPSVPVRCITVDAPDEIFVVGRTNICSKNTTLMTIYALWLTCFEKDKRVVIVANKEKTAILILRRIKTAYEQLPVWLKPGTAKWGDKEVVFGNDSSIAISTTTGSAIRGDSVNALIIDEMAHIEDSLVEEFWTSVIPVISSSRKGTTKVFVVSTPKGTGNMFHKIFSQAEKGNDEDGIRWVGEKIGWEEVPGRGKKWARDMLTALGGDKQKFAQEFDNVFIDTGSSAIDGILLEEMKHECCEPLYTFEDDRYRVYKEPILGHLYGIGVDVAEGVGRAASVVQVLDFTDLAAIEQVAVYHNSAIHPLPFAEVLHRICLHWGEPPVLVERNNIGGEVINALQHTFNYHNLVSYNPDNLKYGDIRPGIMSHTNTKFCGIMNMRYWLNTLKAITIRDMSTIHELQTFVRYPNGTWKAKPGDSIYDDRVMAFVWALFLLDKDICEKCYEIVSNDEQGRPNKLRGYVVDTSQQLLDPYFQQNRSAPLPAIIGADPMSGINNTKENLLLNGWAFR